MPEKLLSSDLFIWWPKKCQVRQRCNIGSSDDSCIHHTDNCDAPTEIYIIHEFINRLRPRQNRRHFADDTFKPIFLNENIRISIRISLKFVPKVPINNIPALVQIMAWRRPGDKPLSEPMMVNLPMHICVTRPQWVKHKNEMINTIALLSKLDTTSAQYSNIQMVVTMWKIILLIIAGCYKYTIS